MNVEDRFQELAKSTTTISVDTMYELFDALPAVDTKFMLGDWEGGAFRTGHRGEKQLEAIRWVGKTFHDETNVDPIISRNGDGAREVNPILGKATLRTENHRGVSTAVMVYDNHPVKDYFRRVNDNIVVGVMDRQGDPSSLFFYLRRMGA
jgi:hypothetical protein